MYNADPRFIMANTYTMLKSDLGLLAEFNEKINKVESPEQAIELCLEYQELANA